MFRNFLLVAWRSLGKRRLFTGIHLIGLSVAFAAAILLFLTAMFELSFDNFHRNLDRIGLVYKEADLQSGPKLSATQPVPMGPALKAALPSIERLSRYGNNNTVLRNGDRQFAATTRFVDPDFLKMFSFPLLEGGTDALDQVDNLVITDEMAKKLFGTTHVTGRSLEVLLNGKWENKIVGAVTSGIPDNSSITFTALMRFEHFPSYEANSSNWDNHNHSIFIQWAGDHLDPELFRRQAKHFMNTYCREEVESVRKEGGRPDSEGEYIRLKILPMTQYHLNRAAYFAGENPDLPWMLLLLAGLILFIAGSNFVNLSLAGAFTRSREMGMRKTLGGRPWQLMLQLWGESALVCTGGLLLGGLVAWMLLPGYNANMNYSLSMAQFLKGANLPVFLVIFLLLTLLAGGYPAWVMSRVNTIETLKGKFRLNNGHSLRYMLTVLQFGIAVLLITGTLVIGRQLHFVQTRPLGFNKTEVISIPVGDEIEKEAALKRMRQELASLPEVQGVTGANTNLGRGSDEAMSESKIGFEFEGKTFRSHWLRVDYDYVKTLDLTWVAGRDFSPAFPTDTNAIVINEKMAAQLGGVEKVLGQHVPINSEKGMKVIGIVKDFHFKDLRQEIEPLTMYLNPSEGNIAYIFVKVSPGNLIGSLEAVEKRWKEVNPRARDAATYLDGNTDNLYRRERRFAHIIVSGAVLAIIISSMGLFALALIAINGRVREIGIRKVLGASAAGILIMLSGNFARMIGIAFVLGAPVAWWGANRWLQGFAYRVELGMETVVAGGIFVFGTAIATVMVQSWRAANSNPVKSLRDL